MLLRNAMAARIIRTPVVTAKKLELDLLKLTDVISTVRTRHNALMISPVMDAKYCHTVTGVSL